MSCLIVFMLAPLLSIAVAKVCRRTCGESFFCEETCCIMFLTVFCMI